MNLWNYCARNVAVVVNTAIVLSVIYGSVYIYNIYIPHNCIETDILLVLSVRWEKQIYILVCFSLLRNIFYLAIFGFSDSNFKRSFDQCFFCLNATFQLYLWICKWLIICSDSTFCKIVLQSILKRVFGKCVKYSEICKILSTTNISLFTAYIACLYSNTKYFRVAVHNSTLDWIWPVTILTYCRDW